MAIHVHVPQDLKILELIASYQLNVTVISTEPRVTSVILAQMKIVTNALMRLASAGPVMQAILPWAVNVP